MVMLVELQATCSALGYQEGQKYVKEPDCLETVKDLIRFLKREDNTCDIRQQLGQAQILQNDLIPLIKHYKKDRALLECVIRLMVNLTQPSILCFNNELPQDKTIRNHYLEVESHLQGYKEAFVDEELFAVLTEKLGDLLKLDWENRHEEDKMFIERLLILVRNILHVPPNPQQEKRTDDDASIHDQVLWALHVSGMEDLLLYIASSDDERQYCVHVLEIISLMFREQTPDLLAHAGVQRSLTEKEKDQRELEIAREKEKVAKLAAIMKQSSRHSRFGGTFVVKNMKSISDRDVICHKQLKDTDSLSFDRNKKHKKQPRNRQAIKDVELVRRSTLSIRLALKDFCVQFLENCYNPLMRAVKDSLVRENTQEHDETYYMWAMRFFMEFCRVRNGKVELVSETMSVPSFHYIYTNLLNYYEMIMTEKKEGKTWSRRVHLALKAYQELLLTLYSMDKSSSSQIRESSKVIKSNVFYMMEFRDIFLTLLKKFDESKQSRSYLKDLIETTHLFVKMLEAFSKQTSHLIVQKKAKKTRQKKKKPKDKPTETEANPELEDLWDDVSSELSALIQGRAEIPTGVTPFDAASEIEVDQQRADAMIRIQRCLRKMEAGEAVAVFRSAREVWPDHGEFGTPDITPEDEFMALREIFFANIAGDPVPEESQGDVLEEEEVQEEEESQMVPSEQEFNFKEYLIRYAKPPILKSFVTLLADFETNSNHTNHCIVKMLHRVGLEMGLMGMLFQASIFRVFQKLLFSPLAKSSHYQELVKFALHLVRHFVAVAPKNDKIFMELLFWKSPNEAREIVEGYGSADSNVKQRWTEHQEQELERLFEEYRHVQDGRDAVDHIMDDITDRDKTRGQIIRQLKVQGLIMSAKDLKRKPPSSRLWTEDQEAELRDLFDTYRDSDDPVGNIVANMEGKRSKYKVIEKILELQLVMDRSALHKKRKGGSRRKAWDDSDSEDDQIKYREEAEYMETNIPVDSSDDEGSILNTGGDNSVLSNLEESVETLVDNVVSNGYKEQIGWVQRTLQRTADARSKSDNPQPVPIVPLTEDNEDAMEDSEFRKFLRKIGLSPPANEQETFWRIPVSLRADDLKLISDSLKLNDENKLLSVETLTEFLQKKAEADAVNRNKSEKSDKKREPKVKKPKKKAVAATERPKLKRKSKGKEKDPFDDFIAQDSEGSDSDSENTNISEKKPRKTPSVKKHSRKSVVNDDSDSDDEPLVSKAKGSNLTSQKGRVKRPLQSDSDDSDDNRLQLDLSDDEVSPNHHSAKRSRLAGLDDSDDETPDNTHSTKKSRVILSDDSDNDGSKLSEHEVKTNRKQHLLDSDDESSRDSKLSEGSSLSRVNSEKNEEAEILESDAKTSGTSQVKGKKSQKGGVADTTDESSRDSNFSGSSRLSQAKQKNNEKQAKVVSTDESSMDSNISRSSRSPNAKQKNNKKQSKVVSTDESSMDSNISRSSRSPKAKQKNNKKQSKAVSTEESSMDSNISRSSRSPKAKPKNNKKQPKVVSTDESSVDSNISRSSRSPKAKRKNNKKQSKVVSTDESSMDSHTSRSSSSPKSKRKNNKKQSKVVSTDESSRDSNISESTHSSKANNKRKRLIVDSDDESLRDDSKTSEESADSQNSKRQRIEDPDSSSLDSVRIESVQPGVTTGQSKAPLDDSDEDTPLILYSQPDEESHQKPTLDTFPATLLTQAQNDSDSEDDHIPLKLAMKQARRIASDDDDDD